mmetsp:Transcript_26388/g.61813  ORF Transcript_26388/g.61813 Transcript_26388/m.61813 type:complete len:610 (+) Transcript_26388:218-2047(+)
MMIRMRKASQPSSQFKFWNMGTFGQSSKWLICLFLLVSCSDWISNTHRPTLYCRALSASMTATFSYPTATLASVGQSQLAVLDGAEWNSVQSILQVQRKNAQSSASNPSPPTKYGYMNIVTGRDENNRRVVAMQCMVGNEKRDSSDVFEDSVAVIPNKVSDADAISTYIASISAVHCALPRLENIGGAGEDSSTTISGGKVVVLGSGELACFSAEGLASLGMEVYLVNSKGNAKVRKNVGKLNIIKPAVGDTELGFASYLGEFDSLVDTIGNERTSLRQDSFEDEGDGMMSLGQSTLQMLRSRHKCYNYVSTLTNSQDIVTSEGLFGGPGKADGYSEKVGNPSFLTRSRECQSITPPADIGSTLETLLKNGVILTEKQRKKACSKKSDAIRGWSLADFWEQMSWPRDSSGSGTTRFGLPVREDLDDVDILKEDMISEAPYDPTQANRKGIRDDDDDDIGEFGTSSSRITPSKNNRAIQKNPFVLNIMDMDGFQSEIVQPKKSCVMFMSARFCKTCKTINPAYTRMARINQDGDNANHLTFVKAETSGALGKEFAAQLSVRAVPSFVFVREGKILGQTYVSKLPSRKIDEALQLLNSGAEWDNSILDDDN